MNQSLRRVFSSLPLLLAASLALGTSAAKAQDALTSGDLTPYQYPVFQGDPTGLTDSSVACNAAMKESSSSHLLRVRPGRYLFSRPCTLTSDAQIWAPSGTATFFTDSNTNVGGILRSVAANNIEVAGIIFDGGSDPTPPNALTGSRLVYIQGGDHVLFRNCVWQNTAGQGIVFSGTSSPISNSGISWGAFLNIAMTWVSIPDATLADTSQAVVFANGVVSSNTGNFVEDTTFELIGSDTADINAQSNFHFVRNHLNLNQKGWKPAVMGGTSGNGTYGIGGVWVFNGSQDSIVADNVIDGATGQCVGIGDSKTQSAHIQVVGNIIKNCGGDAIAVGNVDGFRISGNRLVNNYQSANPALYNYPDIINQGAISFMCGGGPATVECAYGTVVSQNGVIENNLLIDNQTLDGRPAHTMPYGIWQQGGTLPDGSPWGSTVKDVLLSPTNIIAGAVIARYGALLNAPK